MAYLEYKPTDVLYHYTTTDGFKGIIGTKRLWFSDLRTTNDPREIIFGLGRIRPIVARILKDFAADGDIAPLNELIETIFWSYQEHFVLLLLLFSVWRPAADVEIVFVHW